MIKESMFVFYVLAPKVNISHTINLYEEENFAILCIDFNSLCMNVGYVLNYPHFQSIQKVTIYIIFIE